MTDRLTIRRPDDWHVHLRDGAMLTHVAPYTARQFARAIVMPNLSPPVTTVDAGRAYRERLTDIVVMADATGSRAAAEFMVEGEYLATDEGLPEANGQRYVLPGGAFFEIADAADGTPRIARVTNYYNLQDWISQVAG